jgi:hypothetical protein
VTNFAWLELASCRIAPYQHLATTPSCFTAQPARVLNIPDAGKSIRGGTANSVALAQGLAGAAGIALCGAPSPWKRGVLKGVHDFVLNYDVIMHQASHGMEAARNTPIGLVLICSAPSVIETWKALWQSSQLVGIRPKQLLG